MRSGSDKSPTGSSPTCLRIAFWTLGCRLNQYDTEVMKATLGGQPIEIVPWGDAADVYVLNSCTVTGKADQECRRLARQVKRRQPESKVVIAGCYAQTQPDILRRIPEIDGIVGNPDKSDINDWLPELLSSPETLIRVGAFGGGQAFPEVVIQDFDGRSRAFVKVQDGCDLRCSYCLIWRARGPAQSRPVADVHRQLDALVGAGFREVVLAGVHLGAYGEACEASGGLAGLLEGILHAYPELRVRLSSIHPDEITSELLAVFADHPHLRPHLHVSLQSGADSVLRRMRRPYSRRDAYDAISAAAALKPHFGLGADVIVGFPGETDSEFAATYNLIEELPFTYLHVFRFSARPGTPAASLPGQVEPETIGRRAARLRALAGGQKRAFLAGLIGSEREAVVESASGAPGWRQATTDNYAPVLVPDKFRPGVLLRLTPSGLRDGRLYAEDVRQIPRGSDPAPEVA